MLNVIDTYYVLDSLQDKFKSKYFNLYNFSLKQNKLGMHNTIPSFLKNNPLPNNLFTFFSNNEVFSESERIYSLKLIESIDLSSFLNKYSFLVKQDPLEADLFLEDFSTFIIEYFKSINERNTYLTNDILSLKSELNTLKKEKQELSYYLNNLTPIQVIFSHIFSSDYKNKLKEINNLENKIIKVSTECSSLENIVITSLKVLNNEDYKIFYSNDEYQTFLDIKSNRTNNINDIYSFFKENFPKIKTQKLFTKEKIDIFEHKLIELISNLKNNKETLSFNLFHFQRFLFYYTHNSFKINLNKSKLFQELISNNFNELIFQHSLVALNSDFQLIPNLFFKFENLNIQENNVFNSIFKNIQEAIEKVSVYNNDFYLYDSNLNLMEVKNKDAIVFVFNSINEFFRDHSDKIRDLNLSNELVDTLEKEIKKSLREFKLNSQILVKNENLNNKIKL